MANGELRAPGTYLMGDIWACFTDVAAHLPHYTDVIIAVEEIVLVFTSTGPSARAVRRLVRLKGGVA